MTPSTRILIVDDHAHVREDLRMVFQLAGGIEVVGEAGDGQSAVKQAQTLHPDVTLMDLKMPGMDGLQATYQIKRQGLGRVIVLSVYSGAAEREAAKSAGCDAFLVKGAELSTILNTIYQVLEINPNHTQK